ncbi:Sn1-specific diacylglycerol lipase beta [Plakobranchus ocellatus]|uniref:Sn1-specific diacylglycerol lipase beta n=1 Tax=Plakobranchus ocellatus TaxID=259542 RepID=A0AAV3YA00_9GAST|nr:Sn1-specific diacylglycerol lipase beta [Plakobranchus ocellatus]
MTKLALIKERFGVVCYDLVPSSVAELFLQTVWLTVLVSSYIVHKDKLLCEGGHLLKYFYLCTSAAVSTGIILTLVVLYIRMQQDTVSDCWQRRSILLCLYIKLLLLLCEAPWACLATYWIFGHQLPCDLAAVWTAKWAAICMWILILCSILDTWRALNSVPSTKLKNLQHGMPRQLSPPL